jgi:hypothetical protein
MWFIALIALIHTAAGGPFSPKTMQGELEAARIDRGYALPKGWFQVELHGMHKSTSKWRNADGGLVSLDGDGRWDHSRLSLNIDHGFSNTTRLYLRIPWIRSRLRTVESQSIETIGFGDAHVGVWLQPWRGKSWDAALQIDLKTPSGNEWPSSTVHQPQQIDGFLTGTGLTNLGFHLHGNVQIAAPYQLELQVGYTFKLPAIVGYVVEDGGFGNGRLDAGDALDVKFSQLVQPHKALSIQAGAHFSYRGWYRVGASGPGIGWSNPYYYVEPSAFLDLFGDITIEPHPQYGFSVLFSYSLAGADTRPFSVLGLEEFFPQPGLTLGFQGRIRW